MTEAAYMRQLLRDAAKHGMWLFRNNVGMCRAADGRVVKFGLAVGSSDLIGWTEHTVTADDVGRKLAVFTAVETKTASGRPTPAQLAFVEAVRRSGGRAAVLHEGQTLAELAENREG